MAQKVQVLNTCDIHGDDEEATHPGVKLFDANGRPVVIDLCEPQYAKLQKALAPFLEKAVRDTGGGSASRSTSRRGGSKHGSDRPESKLVRKWAVDKGLPIPERGRIPTEIADQYLAEHPIN